MKAPALLGALLLVAACAARSERAESPPPTDERLSTWWQVREGRLVCGRHGTHESNYPEMLTVAEVTSRRFKLEPGVLVELARAPERWGVAPTLAPRFVASWPRAEAARDLRARADRLVERGDLDEAISLYELAKASGDEESARSLETVRALRARMPEETAAPASAALVVTCEPFDEHKIVGHHLMFAASGQLTAHEGANVPWRCDIFPRREFVAWRVLGEERRIFVAVGGLMGVRGLAPEALLCANGTLPGPVFISGVDRVGTLAWQTELPGLGCPPATQAYAHGLGRVFVGHPDYVVALDAATGHVEWARVRERTFAAPSDGGEPERPADWPCSDPARRFSMKLLARTLELTTGGRTRRLDATTGEVLDGR